MGPGKQENKTKPIFFKWIYMRFKNRDASPLDRESLFAAFSPLKKFEWNSDSVKATANGNKIKGVVTELQEWALNPTNDRLTIRL